MRRSIFRAVDQAMHITHLEMQEIQLGKLALDQEFLFHALCLGFHPFDDYNQSC